MKNRILRRWNLFRIVRMMAGVAITMQGIFAADVFFVVAGIMFTLLAALNIGCCAGNTCSRSYVASKKEREQTIYEEVV